MRNLLFILSTGLFLSFCCQVSLSQDILQKEVTFYIEKYTVAQILDSLHEKTDVVFVYSDIIKPNREVAILPGIYSLKQILDSVFFNQNITFVVHDNLIILSPQTHNIFEEEKIIVEGKVISKRNQPVPFAAIYFTNTSKGTIANADGEFRFILPDTLATDTITVSSLGYESVKIAPDKYLSKKLEIHLKTASIKIKDIVIRKEEPEDIITKSYQNRSKNYSNKPCLLSAFFREVSMQNNEYISLTEALIEISKSSYTSSSEDLIRLVKGRNGENINASELVNLVVEGGLYNGLRLDVAKYGSYFYSENALQECTYRLIKTIFFESRQTYVIGFEMRQGMEYAGYKGKLFIDADSYALVRAEFELSPEGIEYAQSALVKKTPRGYKAKPSYARYEVEYRFYNNVWNLHYAHSEINISVKKKRSIGNKSFSCDFVSTSEFVITGQIENPDERIKYKEAAKPGDILVQQVQNTGESFWLEDNIIMPEEPLLNTIEKLQDQGVIPVDKSTISKE